MGAHFCIRVKRMSTWGGPGRKIVFGGRLTPRFVEIKIYHCPHRNVVHPIHGILQWMAYLCHQPCKHERDVVGSSPQVPSKEGHTCGCAGMLNGGHFGNHTRK